MVFKRLNVAMAAGSALLFLVVSYLNELLFHSADYEFVRGMNWIYLPAGVRLLCTLLFGGAGAIGIFIASWFMSVFYFFPDDWMRSLGGSIASALAPYLVYKISQKIYGLEVSLVNLNPQKLLLLAVAYSVANPVLHNIWMMLNGHPVGQGFFVMIIGDLTGTLIILYTIKLGLSLVPYKLPQR